MTDNEKSNGVDVSDTCNKERNGTTEKHQFVTSYDHEKTQTGCGLGSWKMPFFDRFATAAGFTGFFILPQLASQSLTSYINSQIPSLEKQFSLSSSESGVIMTFNDIGFLLVGFIAASIPKLVHVPRWLFCAIVIFAISGLLCSLPHFIIQASEGGQLQINGKITNNKTTMRQPSYPLCSNSNFDNDTEQSDDAMKPTFVGVSISPSLKSLSVGLIGIGMGLQGAGKSIRTPFITEYLDGENKQKTGFYVGILTSSAIFGPVVAYMLGGVFSRMYVTLEDVDMSTKDPRWIGAWWLGFLVFGIMALLVAFPIILFPRKLKEKSENGNDKELPQLIYKDDEIIKDKPKMTKLEVFKERASSYIRVFKSPVYVCLVTMFILHISSVLGPIAFKSKYIEAQFGIPLWKANMIISGTLTATVSIGTLFSGYITKRFKFTPKQLMILILFLQCAQIVFHGSLIFIGCDQPSIVGPGSNGLDGDQTNLPCKCDTQDFFPVCGSNGVNYHSPCYAGCTEALRNGGMYKNCSMIPDGVSTAGLCPFDCDTLVPYIILSIVGAAFGSLKIMPLYIATIRSVEDRDKSTAAGLKSVFASVLAFIPTPIIFGKVIDTACAIWNTRGQRQGSCSQYNLEDLRMGIFGTVLIYKCAAVIFILIPLWRVWNIKDWKDLTKEKDKSLMSDNE